jgi:hypothetical protein
MDDTYNLLMYTSSKNTIYCKIRKEKINAPWGNRGALTVKSTS